MSDPWIEFLDDPEPTPAEPGSPPPRRGSRALVLAGVAALGLVVLVATRAVQSDSAPPQRAQSPAVTEAAQPSPGWVMYVPDGRPCADGTLAECDGADVAIRDAVTEHLRLTVVSQTTDYDAGAGIIERHIEADNGRGTHLIVEIQRSGAYSGGRKAISAGPGAAVVTAEVGIGGYTVQLVAIGPKADVPSRAALAALGNDARLLAA